jgi:hypothetical protein
LVFLLGIIVGECIQIDRDGGNMMKILLIEHETSDFLDFIDFIDFIDFLDFLDLLDLITTNSDLTFKEMIIFRMLFDLASVFGDDEFNDLMIDAEAMMDAEVMKTVLGYRVLGL